VLCQRMLIGPCAFTTDGAVTAAVATAAPPRNLRRVDVDCLLLVITLTLPWIIYPLNISFRVLFHDPPYIRIRQTLELQSYGLR